MMLLFFRGKKSNQKKATQFFGLCCFFLCADFGFLRNKFIGPYIPMNLGGGFDSNKNAEVHRGIPQHNIIIISQNFALVNRNL